jgi:arylsulfatase
VSGRPNIVLVTVDSLRADHCGFHGYEKETTPTLDRLADEGLVFENAIAPGPSTPESMPAIFTGSHPTSVPKSDPHGTALSARRERIRHHMDARETLPERLSALGYETAAFTPNPFTSRYFGFDAGFDRFQDFMESSRSLGGIYERVFEQFVGDGPLSMVRPLVNWAFREEVFKPWASYYDEVVEWIRSAGSPFFLWVFLMDAHNPYMAPAAYRTQSGLDTFRANVRFWRESHDTPFDPSTHRRLHTAYTDAVRYVDAFLDRLRADLPASSTLVVHADHGEAFGEHGVYGHEPHVYEENVHVPLVVDGAASGRAERPVSLCQLPVLLAAIAADEPLDGFGEPAVVSWSRQGNRVALRGRSWKYIRAGEEDALYDLTADERTDRSSTTSLDPFCRLVDRFREDVRERGRTVTASAAVSMASSRLGSIDS